MGGRVTVDGEWDAALTQSITEAPYWNNDDDPDDSSDESADDDGTAEIVYVTPREPPGEERTENVPVPDGSDPERPDCEGQSTLDDWARWSP